MTIKIASFYFSLLVVTFAHGADGRTVDMEDCEGFHASLSSTELDLSSRSIPILRAKCLEGLNHVKTLVLRNCQIQEIEHDAFKTMESLVEVNLSDNLLVQLPDNLFEHNKRLERVSLSDNEFRTVPYITVPFVELDLSRNAISSVELMNILDVQKLDLSFNRLESMSSQDMATLRKVVAININNNPWKCGAEFDKVLCWSLTRSYANSERMPIKCSVEAGYDISYTIPRREKLCDIQPESTDSGNPVTDAPVVETNNKVELEVVTSVSQTTLPGTKKMAFYKSTNSAFRDLVAEEEHFESENVKRWEVFAFIGWMCAAVAIAVLAYIIYAFKLSFKPSYRKIINDDNSSQGP